MITLNKERTANFIKHVQYTLLPIDGQRGIGEGKDRFVDDWLIIELAKALYIGSERYMEEPIPRRLSSNKSFDRKKNLAIVEEKISFFNNVDSLCNSVVIYNMGRGFDILLASMVKDWEMFFCYDEDPRYRDPLLAFFNEPINVCESHSIMKTKEATSIVIKN